MCIYIYGGIKSSDSARESIRQHQHNKIHKLACQTLLRLCKIGQRFVSSGLNEPEKIAGANSEKYPNISKLFAIFEICQSCQCHSMSFHFCLRLLQKPDLDHIKPRQHRAPDFAVACLKALRRPSSCWYCSCKTNDGIQLICQIPIALHDGSILSWLPP